jgi:hypothetical protein
LQNGTDMLSYPGKHKQARPGVSREAVYGRRRADRIGENLGVSIERLGCCTVSSGPLGSRSVTVVPTSLLTPRAAGLLVAALVQADDVVASGSLALARFDVPR